jgi:hypothetical protein
MVFTDKMVSDWYPESMSEEPKQRVLSQKYQAVYMRRWRKTHPLTPEQRYKDNSRSYANVYKHRGKLVPEACICGQTNVEMHHDDYDRPLEVDWMCRECHLSFHMKRGDK